MKGIILAGGHYTVFSYYVHDPERYGVAVFNGGAFRDNSGENYYSKMNTNFDLLLFSTDSDFITF